MKKGIGFWSYLGVAVFLWWLFLDKDANENVIDDKPTPTNLVATKSKPKDDREIKSKSLFKTLTDIGDSGGESDKATSPEKSASLKPAPVVSQPLTRTISTPRADVLEKQVPELPIKETKEIRHVDASRLNVRNGPGKRYKVIWTLKRDQQVQVVERKGAWAKVHGDRFEGWVHGGYLTAGKRPDRNETVSTAPSKPKKKTRKLSDSAIAKILIARDLAYYSGNCPCPYNRTKNNRRCGKRSAYSKPGGEEPLCYRRDITAQMIRDYRDRL